MPDPNSERVAAVFADAWALYGDAIDVLELGKLRLAAEGTWGAVKRATDALILARTGREPGSTGRTVAGIRSLANNDPAVFASLRSRLRIRVRILHAAVFYGGDTESFRVAEVLIRGTGEYIRQAESFAQFQG